MGDTGNLISANYIIIIIITTTSIIIIIVITSTTTSFIIIIIVIMSIHIDNSDYDLDFYVNLVSDSDNTSLTSAMRREKILRIMSMMTTFIVVIIRMTKTLIQFQNKVSLLPAKQRYDIQGVMIFQQNEEEDSEFLKTQILSHYLSAGFLLPS